jgi:hypothetical protein
MKKLTFNKEDDKWYIDLPDFPGPKAELEMVFGADKMLDILAQDKKTVNVFLDIKPFDHDFELIYDREEAEGGWYDLKGQDFEVWLCSVTLYVFGKFPQNLYLKKI